MTDHAAVYSACQHFIAMMKDPNAKPRHIGRALNELRATSMRGLDDAQIAEVLAWGKPVERVQEACANV